MIVVDDAEQLAEAPSLAVVDSLLAGSGELVRVAICSRRSLRLRLAKLRATGRLLELGPADLAFTPAECAACLRAVRGADPSSAEVGRLFELTEGWPLGVALAAAAGEDERDAGGKAMRSSTTSPRRCWTASRRSSARRWRRRQSSTS